jgi:type I restriction enzyme S subunit
LEGLEVVTDELQVLENAAIKEFFINVNPIGFVTLDKTGKWLSGGTPSKINKQFWDGEIPWVSPKGMKVRRLNDAIDHVSKEGAQSGSTLIPVNTILIVVRGLILAHTFPIALTEKQMCFNQDMKALICNDDFLPEYITCFLRFKSQVILKLTGWPTSYNYHTWHEKVG